MAGRSVINVLVNADTKGFVSGMDTASSKIGSFATNGIKNLAKLGAAFAVAGAGAAVVFGKAAFSAAEDMATANARIEEITHSMGLFGDQSDVVSQRLIDVANETARLTGVNQNTIKESQALLMTFAGIADSADEVGGAFDRATQLTVDMAAAGFGSATDNAKQLGKALNDPIKGISALARSGVTFTEQEKEMIKTLVESGKMFEAQDLILTAIETQVGGTAEATANASDKIKVAFSQVLERAGTALMPVFEKLTGFILDKLIPGIEKLVAVFEEDGLSGVLQMFTGFVKSEAPKALNALMGWAGQVGEWFVNTGLPWLLEKASQLGAALVDWIKPRIRPALEALGDFIGQAAKWFVDTGLPWIVEKLQALGEALIEWISPMIRPMLGKLGDWAAAAANWIVDDGLPMLVDKLIELGNAFVDWIKPNIVPMLTQLGELLVAIADWILTVAVPKIAEQALKLFVALSGWVFDLAPEILKGLGTMLLDIGGWILKDGIPTLLGYGADLAGGLLDGILDALAFVGGKATNVAKQIVNAIIGFVNTHIIDKINRAVEFTIDLPFMPSFQVNPPDIPNIPQLAKGGIVTSPTLAMIGEAGAEAVIPLNRAGGSSFGTTVNVTVNAGVGADGMQVGRQIVQILNEYAAGGGARLSSNLVA